ncbi:MAG: alcohol dehydrogenase catalytic domain-containing protein, partial [Halobacteriales archaeon]|nr:alcohol dehydrogenase catalytic domain-containing protein [Halobacteriales archaeon]
MPTMRRVVLREWGGELELEEGPIPEPGPGELRLRVEACGVGSTLRNVRAGRMAGMPGATLPRVLGNEIVGTVEAAGPGADRSRIGQRGIVHFYLTCDRCWQCRWGHDPLCSDLRGLVGVSIDGGFAEHVVVPAANVVPFPAGVPAPEAAVTADAVATPWHALTRVA